MKIKKIQILFILIVVNLNVFGQDFTQTVRGTAIDKDSKMPMIGANVVIVGSDPINGGSTDVNGNFIIKNVSVGRVSLQVTAIGYEPQLLSNIIVESAKETIVNIEGTESFQTLKAMVVTANDRSGETINQMSTVSAKTVTVEETGRYAGSLNDPARMVSAFAGVAGDASGNNDIVVRGNSPRGILWRLEGVEIPNPNHFANEGSTGGPVNTLNASMLANSDFFSGAFAPEYGNALSGVFDTKFRTGNNQKSERSVSLGVLGTEITLEGPFSKKYNGSYLVNYRYSSLELLSEAGILDFGGIPKYQDASFKINLPTKKYGNFQLFGLGGVSSITQKSLDEETDELRQVNILNAKLGVAGLKHNYIINSKTYVQSYISASSTYGGVEDENYDYDKGIMYQSFTQDFSETKYRFSTSINNKMNRRNTLNTGMVYTLMSYNMISDLNFDNTVPVSWVNVKGNTSMMQAYSTWKHRFTEDLTMVSGLHFTQLHLNDNYAFEPRVGLKWQYNGHQYVSLGMGLHSKIESISVYLASVEGFEGELPNENLELSKAAHFVAGFGHQFNENLSFKTEVYYQYLYDIPVENMPNSSFSMLNQSDSYVYKSLVNEGTGANYGLELTLERYFNNNYYYMLTTSLYQSTYTALDNVIRDTKFNAGYAGNIVVGKEFKLRSEKKNKTLAVNLKASLLGGNRYTPIDLEKSIADNETVLDESRTYGLKGDDIFYTNVGITYRVNRKRVTHELKLDIQNVTNNQAAVGRYFDSDSQKIVEYYQLTMIPNLMYTLKF